MDLRFRVLLRRYLSSSTPENAQEVLNYAIRHGIIPTEQEPITPEFGDMEMGMTDSWGNLSMESKRWIRAEDYHSIFDKNYVITIHHEYEEDPPAEVQDLLDKADDEGYSFVVFL